MKMVKNERDVVARRKKQKSFRKLRWKNYLHHLLNLLLFCVSLCGVSLMVDGKNCDEIETGREIAVQNENETEHAVNLSNFFKKIANSHASNSITNISNGLEFFMIPFSNTTNTKQNCTMLSYAIVNPMSAQTSPNSIISNYNSKHNLKVSHVMSFKRDSHFNESNKNSFSARKVQHLIKSQPYKRGSKSNINHGMSRSDYSTVATLNEGRKKKVIKAENVANATRNTSDLVSIITSHISDQIKNRFQLENLTNEVKNVNRNRSESIIIHNQSYRSAQPKRPSRKNVKKVKITTEIPPLEKEKNILKTHTPKLGKVSLLGLFELTTRGGMRAEGQSELFAAELAIRHINEREILPGYTLELITNDTQCDPGVGVDRFFHAIYTQNNTKMVMLLGTACSEVTESLAKVVPYWNIIQVSFGSIAPALSDREEFPYFFRTVMPDSAHNPARIAFIRRFKWETITTFTQNGEAHSLAVNDLVTQFERANISCAAVITFGETDFKDQLQMLRDLDTRIIIGSFSHEMAPKVFCEAYKLGMYGADYAWILQETFEKQMWWNNTETASDCSTKHLHDAIENVVIISSFNNIVGEERSISGMTNKMFESELSAMSIPKPYSRFIYNAYDAVWSIALALKRAEQVWLNETQASKNLESFDYTRKDMAKEFLEQFSHLNFQGISGQVSFDGADRIGVTAFYQIQNAQLLPVALYYPETEFLDFLCSNCITIQWKNGQVPIAKRIFKLRVATISKLAFFIVVSLAVVGIILSLMFLAFNLHFRKLKSIKLSSYKLSNITAAGCILVYGSVILLGLDHSTLPSSDTAFPTVCTARVYLLSAGFSLTFGSMFAKTYRVHRIFTHSWGGICRDKMLKDTKLISMVCCLLLVDALVVTFWTVSDPMERHLRNLTLEISSTDRSVVYQPQVEVCQSLHAKSWLGILYIYKGLLLVVGVYMAWETRHVKIPALNDSQYIGFSVYGAVITSFSVVVLANLLSEQVTLAFIIITFIILTSTTATLCLVFLPKMNDIWNKGAQKEDPVIHSMGLKMEYNTRRFVTDDRRELQYRVEVQNRVYRKEMATLDAEITKLERLLENRSSSTSSSQVSMIPHIKPEIIIDSDMDAMANQKSARPSISGGLPLLLLSVLPPVIPRASWPNATHMQIPMRRSVCFSSQPQMDERESRIPAIDLLHLRLTHQQHTERTGFLTKIKGLFGSRAPSRKTSTASLAPSHIANALKSHMNLLTGLLPNTSTSCQVLNTNPQESDSFRKASFAQSGTAINTQHIEIVEPELIKSRNRRKSMAFTISAYIETDPHTESQETEACTPEPRVNFILPNRRRSSIIHQNSQPTLRERVKGSPRFPHRIVPTSSLNALEDTYNVKTCNNDGEKTSPAKWKSMEEGALHATNNKLSLTLNLDNLDKISIANDSNKNIESIDEEIIHAPNHVNDDFYGVV